MQKFSVRPVSDDLVADLSEFVRSETGLHFPKEKWHDLRRGIDAAASDFGFTSPEACARWILSASLSGEQIDLLVSRLTVGETFFFRDEKVFQALREQILFRRFQGTAGESEKLNFWSAGCCTGEEPYSLAILLDQLMSLGNRLEATITGTDINPDFLQKAREGVYSRWSFRETPDSIIDRYFARKEKNRFEILPRIKKMVGFYKLNLVQKEAAFPDKRFGAMDVIFCRNVLLYFSSETRAAVIDRLTRSLKEGGWLIPSPTEIPFIEQPELSLVKFSGRSFFRKGAPREGGPILFRPGRKSGSSVIQQIPFNGSPRSAFPAMGKKPQSGLRKHVQTGAKEKSTLENVRPSKAESEEPAGKDRYEEALKKYDQGLYRESVEEIGHLLNGGHLNGRFPPLKPEHMALMARSLANLGKLEEAGKWAMKAVKSERLKPDHPYLLATICQEGGLLEESIKWLKQALYLDPELIMAWVNLANLMKKKGDKDGSERYSRNALSLLSTMAPDEPVPHSEGVAAETLVRMLTIGKA